MDLQAITNPQELLDRNNEGGVYLFENFIKTRTMGDRRRAKRKLKVLKAVDPLVRQLLDEDETVFFVTDGMLVRTFEQLFIGWVAGYYNLMAFVFTTKRVFLIHLKSHQKKGVFLRSIEYVDIKGVTGSRMKNFRIRLRKGTDLLFYRMPAHDRKELSGFLNEIVDTNAVKDPNAQGMRNLCPRCFHDHGDRVVPDCAACGLEFKSPSKAALLSLLMPGLGDVYLGSAILGVVEIVVMSLIWLSLVGQAVQNVAAGSTLAAELLSLALFWIILHPLDALKSHYMGKKGLFPAAPLDGAQSGKGSTLKWMIGVPAVLSVIFFGGLMVIGFLGTAGVLPSLLVMSAEEMPEQVVPQLVEKQIIDAGEEVLYFYGGDLFSYDETGVLLTPSRLVLYFHDPSDELVVYEMPYERIRHVELISKGDSLEDSWYRAVGYLEDEWIQFNLSPDDGGDERFIAELNRRIPAVQLP